MAEAEAMAAAPAPVKRGGLGLILVAMLVAVGASGGVGWFLYTKMMATLASGLPAAEGTAVAAPAKPRGPAIYHALEPAFIANLEGERHQRFLQVQVDVMSRNAKSIESVKVHAPQIRSRLLMLFGQQTPAQLATREGKESLQAAVLDEVRAILLAETGDADVEAVFFSTFVMQ